MTTIVVEGDILIGSNTTAGGLGVLVYQAALACKLWTGQMPPTGVMHSAADRAGMHI